LSDTTSSQDSKKDLLSTLLLKLHHDTVTGVVTVKDNQRTIKIYLNNGHIVYADGIDKESQLLKEIAAKRKLDQNQSDELNLIKENDPQSLGEALIRRKLITQPFWDRFLELKVKHTLAAACDMETADLGFSKTELSIAPNNRIDYNILQLLLDTIRGIKKLEHFKKYIPGDNTVFDLSEDDEGLDVNIPLSPSEQAVFLEINGRKAVGEIITVTGLEKTDVYRTLYLLLCFDLIYPVLKEDGKRGGFVVYTEIINLYLDLLRIMEANFQKEVGKEFERIFDTCRDELPGQSKEILHGLDLSGDSRKAVVKEILGHFTEKGNVTEGRLLLLSSFNKLIFLLIMRMKKVLGIGLTEKTLDEMMDMLGYLEKYRQDAEIMNYIRGNLKDYMKQIKS